MNQFQADKLKRQLELLLENEQNYLVVVNAKESGFTLIGGKDKLYSNQHKAVMIDAMLNYPELQAFMADCITGAIMIKADKRNKR